MRVVDDHEAKVEEPRDQADPNGEQRIVRVLTRIVGDPS